MVPGDGERVAPGETAADFLPGRRYRRAHLNLPRPRKRACLALPADGQDPFHTESRAMDGGLARLDADRDDRRPRNAARTERVPGHGGALGDRLADPVSPDPPPGRVRGDANVAAVAAYRAQPRSLCRADRLVLLADADSAGPGGLDRIHDADLDRDPGRELSRRAHDVRQGRGHRARRGRRDRHCPPRGRRDQSGPADRACARPSVSASPSP